MLAYIKGEVNTQKFEDSRELKPYLPQM